MYTVYEGKPVCMWLVTTEATQGDVQILTMYFAREMRIIYMFCI